MFGGRFTRLQTLAKCNGRPQAGFVLLNKRLIDQRTQQLERFFDRKTGGRVVRRMISEIESLLFHISE